MHDSHALRMLAVMLLFGIPTIAVTGLFILIAFPYILTLRNALLKCAPESRTISEGNLWLLLIPFFNLGWHFVVVLKMARTLKNEAQRRHYPNTDHAPGETLGLAMCILMIGSRIPPVGILLAFAGLNCWVLYWIKIAEYSRRLDEPVYISQPAM